MIELFHPIAAIVITLLGLTWIGNLACRFLFRLTGLSATPSGASQAGRVIGSLERLTIALGVIAQRWEVLAAVIALKTLSRFKDLDERQFAEYFLVGSLISILWASVVTLGLLCYDHFMGLGILGTFDFLRPSG